MPTLDPLQFQKIFELLQQIASKPNTITGMHDWNMLVTMFSMFGGVLLLMIGGGIGYILNNMDRDRKENKDEHKCLWQAHEDCQTECCPRRGRREGEVGH